MNPTTQTAPATNPNPSLRKKKQHDQPHPHCCFLRRHRHDQRHPSPARSANTPNPSLSSPKEQPLRSWPLAAITANGCKATMRWFVSTWRTATAGSSSPVPSAGKKPMTTSSMPSDSGGDVSNEPGSAPTLVINFVFVSSCCAISQKKTSRPSRKSPMREPRLHLNCAPDTAASDWTPTSGHDPCPGRRHYRQPPLMRPPKKEKCQSR